MPEDLFTREAHARTRLALVLASFTLLMMAATGLVLYFFHDAIAPPFSFWLSFAFFWIVYFLYAVARYYYGGKWLYEMVKTLPPWKTDYRLRDALNDALLAEGLDRKVRLYDVPHSAINAFSLALPDGSFALFATQGLADKLPDEELQAVMAHELGHIRTGDTQINTFFMRLAGRSTLKLNDMGMKRSFAFEAEEAPVLMELDTLAMKRAVNELPPLLGRKPPPPLPGRKKKNIFAMIIAFVYIAFMITMMLRVVRESTGEVPNALVIQFLVIVAVNLALLLYLLPLIAERLFRFAVDREREYYADLWAIYLTRDPLCVFNAIRNTAEDVHDVLVIHPVLDPLLFHPVVSYTSYQPYRTQPSAMQRLQRLRNDFPQDLA